MTNLQIYNFEYFLKFTFIIIILILLIINYKALLLKKERIYIIILLLITLVLTLIIPMQTVYNKSNKPNSYLLTNISDDRIIIIGDSRMSLIVDKINEYTIPFNLKFIAKSGMKIDWTKEEALPELKEILNKNKKYQYHVVFNMGVNDIDGPVNPRKRASEYINLYKQLSKEYPKIKIYILSVNPINELTINKNFINKRKLIEIKQMNNEFKSFKDEKITYCDSYNKLNFTYPDGLHYKHDTSQKIIDFIVKDCIKYN